MCLFKKQPKVEVIVQSRACNHKVCYKCGHLFETGGKEIPCLDYLSRKEVVSFCKNCIPNCDYSKEMYVVNDSFITKETHYFRHQPDIEVNEKGD